MNRTLIILASMGVLGLLLLGGCATCPSNQKAGIPIIVCQPENQQVRLGDSVRIKVAARGVDLIYRWYKNDEEILCDANKTANTPVLQLHGFEPSMLGLYRCVIEGHDKDGNPVLTSTREAEIGYFVLIKDTPQPAIAHKPMPTLSTSESKCGPYCGWRGSCRRFDRWPPMPSSEA